MAIAQQFTEFIATLRECIQTVPTNAPAAAGATLNDDPFNTLALRLFTLQFEANSAYARLCAFRKVDPESVRHWTQIPAVPTVAFKEMELTSLPPARRYFVFHSSGTTEHQPSRHFHDAISLAVYEASLKPWFKAHMLADGDHEDSSGSLPDGSRLQMISLTPPPAEAPHSSLAHMIATVAWEWGASNSFFAGTVDPANGWTLNRERLLDLLRAAAGAGRAVMLLGTAFNFVHLLDEMAARSLRLRLPDGSRVMETGGYKGRSREIPKPELHRLISEHLGVPPDSIICEYGMSELSSQAYDRAMAKDHSGRADSLRGFRFPPWARFQVISPETGREAGEGEPGLIRVFDLANVRSVMAIQTEDLGFRQGTGFELIGRASRAEARGCSLLAV